MFVCFPVSVQIQDQDHYLHVLSHTRPRLPRDQYSQTHTLCVRVALAIVENVAFQFEP